MRDVTTDSRRPYRSALRDEQSRATRRRVVDAGAELFVERGYVPTTIDAIAERAGVSRRTVFTSVGGKAAVLKLAFDWTLARHAQTGGKQVLLAGGLDADNVAQAVRLVRPFGVDVASGVERAPGVKDADKVRRFVDAAKGRT